MGIKDWNKEKDPYGEYATTVYVREGYTIGKGRYCIFSVIYSAVAWHLRRLSDNKVIYSAKTAKECMEAFDNGVR